MPPGRLAAAGRGQVTDNFHIINILVPLHFHRFGFRVRPGTLSREGEWVTDFMWMSECVNSRHSGTPKLCKTSTQFKTYFTHAEFRVRPDTLYG